MKTESSLALSKTIALVDHAPARSWQSSYATAVRQVDTHHELAWQELQREALGAHEAFVTAARAAAVARHKGQNQRAQALTAMARKQHHRWLETSQSMSLYER